MPEFHENMPPWFERILSALKGGKQKLKVPAPVLNMRFKVPDLACLVLYITQSLAIVHSSADESTISQVRYQKKKKKEERQIMTS